MKDYRIDIRPYPKKIRVSWKGTVLASSPLALQLDETGHQRVFYIPLEDVKWELFEPSEHQTHCPLKGDASYWSLNLVQEKLDNLLWAYKNPFPAVSEISAYVAFYQDRVDIETYD